MTLEAVGSTSPVVLLSLPGDRWRTFTRCDPEQSEGGNGVGAYAPTRNRHTGPRLHIGVASLRSDL